MRQDYKNLELLMVKKDKKAKPLNPFKPLHVQKSSNGFYKAFQKRLEEL